MNNYTKPWCLASALLVSLALPSIAQADWPVAIVDSASATASESITIQVLENDIGEGLELTKVNTTTKQWGSASINSDNKSVTYQPRDKFIGTDTFWYDFKDSEGRTNAAIVTVTVTEAAKSPEKPAEWPLTQNDTIETTADTSIKIPVLNNDIGVGLTITFVNEGTIGSGTAEIVDNGQSILYTPAKGYTGTDEFWYVFNDQWGRANAGKVSPVVTATLNYQGWPTAEPDYASVTSTATVAIPVLNNDVGQDLKLLEVNTTTVGLGKASIEENYIRYTPADGFTGQDSFWYNFEDAQGRKNSTQIFVEVSENTALSSIEFCGSTYTTDGTAENTKISSLLADPKFIEIDLTRKSISRPGDLIILDDRRYYKETDGSLWMADLDTGANAQVISTQSDIELLGAINNQIYYIYLTRNPSSRTLLTHDGSESKVLGKFIAHPMSTTFNLEQSDSDIYVSFLGLDRYDENFVDNLEIGTYDNQLFVLNKLTNAMVHLASNKPNFDTSTVDAYQSAFLYNGFKNPAYNVLPFGGFTQSDNYFIGLPDDPDRVLGNRDRAIVSNDRLLMTTQTSTYADTDGTSTDLPATLYTATNNNELIELAVCNQ